MKVYQSVSLIVGMVAATVGSDCSTSDSICTGTECCGTATPKVIGQGTKAQVC